MFIRTIFLTVLFGLQAQANSDLKSFLSTLNGQEIVSRQIPNLKGVPLAVGDFQERRILKGSLKVGSLNSWVDRKEGKAYWLINDLRIIFKPKQIIEALIDNTNGEILRYIVNGEEKNPPDLAEADKCKELSEVKQKVKVPAGTFDTLRTIAQCEEDILAIWVNDEDVNMGGHVRQAKLDEKADPSKPEFVVELMKFGQK